MNRHDDTIRESRKKWFKKIFQRIKKKLNYNIDTDI